MREGNRQLRPDRLSDQEKSSGKASADVTRGASTVDDWRRITLEKQLPRPHFPGGVSVPSLVTLVCLTLISGLCVIYLGEPRRLENSAAVAESQRELARSLARSLQAISTEVSDELVRAVEEYAADPRRDAKTLLDGLAVGQSTSRWRSAALVDPVRRTALVTVGEALLLGGVPPAGGGVALTPIITTDGNAVLVASAKLADGRELVASANLSLRALRLDAAARQSILIALGAGASAHSQGVELSAQDLAVTSLVERAARAATSERQAISIIGGAEPAPIVTAAPVGSLELVVVSVVGALPAEAGARWQGVPAAAALVGIALLMLLVIQLGFLRPIRRLLRHAKAAACGEVGPHKRLSRLIEVRRIAVALDGLSFRTHGHGRRRPAKRGGIPSIVIIAVCSSAIVVWSGAVMVSFGRGAEKLPAQVVLDSQNKVDGLAVAVRDILQGGPQELARIAADHRGPEGIAAVRDDLERLTDRDGRYRSLYLLDEQGREVTRVGREPRRGTGVPEGEAAVTLDRTSVHVPLLLAYAPYGSSKVVAEYDVRFLSSVLRRLDGTVRIVDAELRTIVSTSGYVAFSALSPEQLRHTATESLTERSKPQIAQVGQLDALILASSLTVGSATQSLRFAVVFSRSLVEFPLARNDVRKGAWLVAFLGVCTALLFAGWYLFVVVIPIRRLGSDATRLADGDTTQAVSAVRHDEVGAVAICLEICRQARVHGAERLAGGARLRGGSADHTSVLSRIPEPRGSDGDRSRRSPLTARRTRETG